jgi:hypothetical protein
MSYTINLTNGSTLVPGGISDGTVDTNHTSLVLIGKNYAGYGQFLNENFVKMLENFANTSSPANPLTGQLWWDATNNILKVWSGASWKISTGATSAPFNNPPGDLSALGGDLWFDTTNAQLKVYSGTSWITVGPAASVATGDTGAVPAIMVDTSSGSHIVIQFRFSGVIYAIFSKDTFTSALTGFTTIKAGINFSTVASPAWGLSTQDTNATNNTLVQRDGAGGINGVAINGTSVTAGVITATNSFNGTFNGNLTGNVTASTITSSVINTAGITASSGYSGTLLTANQPNVTGLGNVVNLNTNGTTRLTGTTNIVGYGTYNGSEIAVVGGGGSATFSSLNNTVIGNVTPTVGTFTTLVATTSLTPFANAVTPLGGTSSYWGNVYATGLVGAGTIYGKWSLAAGATMNASYADLAERFHADAEYAPGTVVEMGGANEITQVVEDLSSTVFGVISTNAAYLMNSGAGEDATHPPIAMSGRVPVRVIGLVNKGDRLVSAGLGRARAGSISEITPWNVIGRALENKTDDGESLIEAIVRIIS